MKNTIEGFEVVYDEGTLLLCKKVNNKDCFLQIDISLASKTIWANLVEDDDEYHEFIGEKLKSRIKKSLAESLNNK
jgi:hypothetical protein